VYNGPPPAGEAAGPRAAGDARTWRCRRGFASRSWPVRVLLLAPILAAALVAIGISVQLVRYTIRFPDPRALTVSAPGPRLQVLARDGSLIAERGDGSDFIPLDRLPRHLVDAVIATEDRRFFSHWGVDPGGLLRAAFANLRAGRAAQGGSTITQQLAKNLFLSTERTFSRKAEESVLALWLEIRLSKREILELYLNRVYFGGGAYGVDAAAKRYFGKPARSVNLAEAAVIAGLLKAPSRYSPLANPGYARARARVVIQAMLEARLISPLSAAAASRQSVQFSDPERGKAPTGLEYAVDYVLDRLPPLGSVADRVVIVETTIDPDVQRNAQAVLAETLAKQGAASHVGQGALVMMDTGGGIRALVGGRSFAESQFNRAVKARRQPGSAFKPFVYIAALESGYRPDTAVVDAPIEIGDWAPRNDDGRYRGPLTLTQALAHSVNTVAVRLQQQVGGDRVAAVAHRLGIASPLRPDASMALGTSEVGLLELCSAYGSLAAGGLAVEPFAIRRVRTTSGEVLYQRAEPRPRLVVAPDTIGAINTMLNAAVVSGTGRRAAFPSHQAGGKTGTTQDYRDAWFVGYTAHFVGGVWFGNDDGSPMQYVMGGGLPAMVWRDVMSAAHASLLPRALPAIDDGVPDPLRAPATEPPAVARALPEAPAMARGRAMRSPAVAASVVAGPATHAGARARPVATPVGNQRRPLEPIDPDFIARVIALPPASTAMAGGTVKGATFDPRRIRDNLQ
jgi:penicillin-binding protein 1A